MQALGGAPNIHVTFLGVTKRANECQEGARIHSHSPDHVTFACLEAAHFQPEARARPAPAASTAERRAHAEGAAPARRSWRHTRTSS